MARRARSPSARRAAATALSMSAAVPRAILANGLPSDGSTTSIVCPVADSTHRLSMK
jgi:hypothetical protein